MIIHKIILTVYGCIVCVSLCFVIFIVVNAPAAPTIGATLIAKSDDKAPKTSLGAPFERMICIKTGMTCCTQNDPGHSSSALHAATKRGAPSEQPEKFVARPREKIPSTTFAKSIWAPERCAK